MIPIESWRVIAKLAFVVGAAAAIATLVFRLQDVSAEREALRTWQGGIVETVTTATVPADAKGARALLQAAQVPGALAGIIAERDEARGALREISGRAVEAKARSDAEDAAMVKRQAENDARFAVASAEIARLKAAGSTGNAEADCKLIDAESDGPWRAWK